MFSPPARTRVPKDERTDDYLQQLGAFCVGGTISIHRQRAELGEDRRHHHHRRCEEVSKHFFYVAFFLFSAFSSFAADARSAVRKVPDLCCSAFDFSRYIAPSSCVSPPPQAEVERKKKRKGNLECLSRRRLELPA